MDGNIYLTDNNTIRKITPAGVVTTLAGAAGISGSTDGPGGVARFSNPMGLAVDGFGNIYVADVNNNTIRKITPAGVVTTLAGTAGAAGYVNGTGAAARFSAPRGVTVELFGTVYVADTLNSTIRKITTTGVVTTYAGTGSGGHADGPGNLATFANPMALAIDGLGNVYVSDTLNHTIRLVTPAP